MDKVVLVSASCYNQKYFMNPDFNELPTEIRNALRVICITLAEKIHGIFSIGFYNDGSVFIEAVGDEVDHDYDDIGAKLEIERLKIEEKELIRTLALWYSVFKTTEGKKIKDELYTSIKNSNKDNI